LFSTLTVFASEKAKLFFSFFFLQEVSGDDDIVDAGVETAEVNEGIVERREVALESTDEVVAKDSPADGSDSGGTMADETLGVTVSNEAVLAMAGEAVQETTSIMAEEVPDEIHVSMADVVCVDKAYEIAPAMADEAFTGIADGTRVDTAHEVIPVVANFNIAIIVGFAAEDDHDQDVDSVDSEETISDEPQPLQIIPFANRRDKPRTIDPVGFRSNPPFARMASIMEGISLFGVAPRFERVFREESSPVVVSDCPPSGVFIGSQVPALEGTSIQDADDGDMADTEVCGVDVVPEGDISLVDESKLFFFYLSPLFVTFFFFFLVRW
jgi:hypothetical protein